MTRIDDAPAIPNLVAQVYANKNLTKFMWQYVALSFFLRIASIASCALTYLRFGKGELNQLLGSLYFSHVGILSCNCIIDALAGIKGEEGFIAMDRLPRLTWIVLNLP